MLDVHHRRPARISRAGLACLGLAVGIAAGLALAVGAGAGRAQPEKPAVAGESLRQERPAVVAAEAERPQAPAADSQSLREDQAALLRSALSEAATHGFRPGEFGPVNDEAGLRRAIIAYAAAQHGARLPAKAFEADWSVRPEPYDAAADFAFALRQDRLAAWLAGLPPPFERYRALRTVLARYRAIRARGGWEAVDAGPALKPGATDPRVVELRRRLAAEGADIATGLDSLVYDPALQAAVAAAQARFGLGGDGVVGPATLKALNVPVEARIAQIEANMERWRWAPRAWPATRVEVNIAARGLAVYQDNRIVSTMKVVVGEPDKKTPMLRSEITSLVLNPPWNVPASIAARELVPKGPAYLARNGYVWVSNGAGGSRLQQRPGPNNSLGRIKFDFSNPFGVYLHDTDAKGAFELDQRALSHGCVRVERPEELADLLLAQGQDWSPDRLEPMMAGGATKRVRLATPTPVFLLYWTVVAGADGQVAFYNDDYGWDADLAARLGAGARTA